MRLFSIVLSLAFIVSVPWPAKTQAPPLTPEQREKLKDREAKLRAADRLFTAGKFEEAAAAFRKIVELEREVLGPTHPDVLEHLHYVAFMHEENDDYPAAKTVWEELVVLRAKHFGPDHWQTVDARLAVRNTVLMSKLTVPDWKQLAEARKWKRESDVARRSGKLRDAIELGERILAVRKKLLGADHHETALILNNLGLFYKEQGRYREAELSYTESLRIGLAQYGRKHPQYAMSLNNAAALYRTLGHYAKSERLHLEAMAIRKEVLGPRHPDYAMSLNNLGLLYDSQGQYAKAEALYTETLNLRKEILGEKHPDYATSLNNLAVLHANQKQFDKAEPLYRQALAIRKEALGVKHREYGSSIHSLGMLQRARGNYKEAEPLLLEALGIFRDALGPKHPLCATVQSNLAGVYDSLDNPGEALKYAFAAMQIRKDSLGVRHPEYALSLNNLATLYRSLGRYREAEKLCREAVEITFENLIESGAVQTEADQLQQLAAARLYLDNYLKVPDADASMQYQSVFRWHGTVTARQMFTRAMNAAGPETQAEISELRDTCRLLNQLVQNPSAATTPAQAAQRILEAGRRREALEKGLASQAPGFAAYQMHLRLKPAELQKKLPERTVLVDFIATDETITAFVVSRSEIRRVALEGGANLGEELALFLSDLSLERKMPVTGSKDVGVKLRNRLWEPLGIDGKDIDRVLLCPDGPLCRLPFAALPGSDPKRYLLEERSIVVVPVPQLLPGLLNAKRGVGEPTLLAVGNVDFNGDPAAGEPAKPAPVSIARAGNGLAWNALPHTKSEVETISVLFRGLPKSNVKPLLGREATEAAIEREMPKHCYLHLATHGFFAPPKFTRQLRDIPFTGQDKFRVPVLPPGLSSGIVCAGVNMPNFQSIGILTATQIAELDLRNVELVVLSACETGLGELAGGEGVLGLQRAFQIAGARSTISSLWAIPDQATAELMKRMYSSHLKAGLPAADALREAQLWVLNNGDKVGVFDEPPRGTKRTPPRYWAAFTYAGDWR